MGSSQSSRIESLCVSCGTRFFAEAASGHCPKCLFRLAWTAQPEREREQEAGEATVNPAQRTAALPEIPVAELFGDYELGAEIARGGMGIVRRARQISLNRPVALKLIATGPFASPALVQRFQVEAAAAARLDHPSIVPIYEIGEHRGQVYYSMKLVEGGSLAARMTESCSRPSPRQCAQWLLELAEAIEFAHQHGVLHRDLKPSNVLIESTGRACLADFGLAKVVEEESGLTLSTATLGTPAYMAPEQAEGKAREISTASDIYSLGAILYELLTGRPPFHAERPMATMRQVIEQEPTPPRVIRPGAPRDLETICLKCLEKAPPKRYASARDLADDLRRFLRDEPVKARPVTSAERAWRWCRRKPALAAIGAVALLLLLLLMIGGPIALYRIGLEKRRAETARAEEATLRQRAQAQAYTADMNNVLQAWKEGNFRLATNLLAAHVPRPGERDRRGFEWHYLAGLCRDERRLVIPPDPMDPLWKLAASPNHAFIAGAWEHTVRLLDPRTGRELLRLPYPNPDAKDTWHLIALASHATNILAAHRGDGLIGIWDLSAKTLQKTVIVSNELRGIALSPDGRLLATVEYRDQTRTLKLWDLTGRSDQAGPLWSNSLYASSMSIPQILRFSPDGQALISDAKSWTDGTIAAWEVPSWRELAPFPALSVGILDDLVFSPDGRLLASAGVQSEIELWDFVERKVSFSFKGHWGRVNSLAFSPDGQRLAAACADGTIRVWDIPSRAPIQLLQDSRNRGLGTAVFSPDGKSLISLTDGELSFWDAEPGSVGDTQFTGQELGGEPGVSPDGRWLVTLGTTNWNGPGPISSGRVWDIPARRERFGLAFKRQEALDPVFSPDGKYLAVGGEGQEYVVGIWDTTHWGTASGAVEPLTWLTNQFEACSLAFSPDGKVLAAAGLFFHPIKPSGATNRLAFWEAGSWRKLDILRNAGAGPTEYEAAVSVAFSSDGRCLAVGYRDGTVRLWDFKEQRLLAVLKEQKWPGYGARVCFSADGHWLASVAIGSDLAVYDVSSVTQPRLVLHTQAHPGGTWSAHFAPDRLSLATSGNDGLIRFWNLETLKVALTLEHSFGPDVFLRFSPKGDLLVTQDGHGTIKFWPAIPAN